MEKQWHSKKVLVLGAAKSGIAAATYLHHAGADVTINTGNIPPEDEQDKIQALGIRSVFNEHPVGLLNETEVIVKNPGIPYQIPLLQEAISREIPIYTEVELAYLATEADFVAITGSNGKTTTTTLVYELLKGGKRPVHLAGNIGFPSIEVAADAKTDDLIVIELSSFQLMGVESFHPRSAALLNLSEAHLDYHGDFDSYADAKGNLFRQMTRDDQIVVKLTDSEVMKRVPTHLAPNTFSFERGDASVVDGWVTVRGERVIRVNELALGGAHNVENVLAALLLVEPFDIPKAHIERVLRNFGGVAHRTESLGDVLGRAVYNDSKATNNVAAEAALRGFDAPVVWLCGGLERGADLSSLVPALSNVKAVVAYGETKERFKELGESQKIPSFTVETLTDAVALAFEQSETGDIILLSPACASWDQFKTFEERGEHFIHLVRAYEEANR
ncbi:UDP-N-acetylmuramoyl-L-alanine--D-glutamate ligase [Exiguobacterium marinum]|uniref:UDP-N-acetylmuramoylalanine--D-glutamate ligase n=1 Tax=Exiguobacterium marinum TaxID=273528 RepID=A0ABY7X4A5_9BACL|nr:UDP-N-acetylmuramoyl-L-alanine--D-glutamate ligase [Exiguobacterium marinum]WDH76923.1 UDP-N-acetylmuramoyl-L-alanine--D-glutamate ligase [Exiguobacterium marinum]